MLKQDIEARDKKKIEVEKQFSEKVENTDKAKEMQERLVGIKEVDPLLEAIGEEIKSLTKASTVLLFTKDASNRFHCRKVFGSSIKALQNYKTDAKKDIAFGEVACAKKPFLITKIEIKIVLASLSKTIAIKNILLLPLLGANEVMGVACCLNKTGNFDQAGVDAVEDFGSRVNLLFQNVIKLEKIKAKSIDLENFDSWLKKNRKAFINILEDVNKANSDLEKSLSQTMSMYRIAVELSKSLDENKLLETILRNSIRLLQTRKGCLVINSHGRLTEATKHNLVVDLHLKTEKNPIKWSAEQKKPIIINDFSKTGYKKFCELTKFKNIIAVPLIQGSRTIGVLCLFDKTGGFSRKDSQALETLAHQATVVILNARVHEQEKKTIKKLKELDKMKADFVAGVSHELRSPLTTIRGYVDLISEGEAGPLTDTQTDFLSIVDQSSARLTNLINDLLTVAKIESDGLRMNKRVLSINDVLESVKKVMLPDAKQHDLQLKLKTTKSSISINGDANRLEQVLINFISNAIKFSESGGFIELFEYKKGDTVVVGVKDNGIGISKDDKRKLFEKFFRSDEVRIKNIKGTGLGLAIAKGIIEQHGGKIGVESTKGKGSTFYFSLPIKKKTAA